MNVHHWNREKVERYIQKCDSPVFTFRLKQRESDGSGAVFWLDDINPNAGLLNAMDARAINAGYLPESECIYRKALEALEFSGTSEMYGLIEAAEARIDASFSKADYTYVSDVRKLVIRKFKETQRSISDVLEITSPLKNPCFRVRNMRNPKLRAVVYALISRAARQSDSPITFLFEDAGTLLREGNWKAWLQTFPSEHATFLFLEGNDAVSSPTGTAQLEAILG